MLEFIYEFRYAFAISLIVGIICPFVGTFIVVRRLSVIGEVLSNMSLSGVALGSLLGSIIPFSFVPTLQIYGTFFAIIGALLVEWLRKRFPSFSEISIPILLAFGMGLSVVLFSAMNGFNVNIQAYLFGNLLAVNKTDLITTLVIGCVVLIIFLLLYKEFFAVTFDAEYSRLIGIPRRLIQFLLIIIIALTISVTVRSIGSMLVSGLMVLPVATSLLISRGFKSLLLFSMLFSVTAIFIGLFFSYLFNLATGGTIILISALLFLSVLLIKKWGFQTSIANSKSY
ncbi:metal ABC transporter permease [Caldibacillus lycopersici]|uniref:Metal ABC transporter permease n=1 Tax=Perspicuibacillus lycopersici TaxID=1325689 RepID=A0AAE3LLW9_9BACI|nr:metal ABC transporter permease [Perspicuibacillus lycopersici]MCU9612895.1 metal ABC transporter permease [Perspicuibacillus lycopersici]